MKLGVLNTFIITGVPGTYRIREITREQANDLCLYALGSMGAVYSEITKDPLFDPYIPETCGKGLDSAVGHQSTADIMTAVLTGPNFDAIGTPVTFEVHRQQFCQQVGQLALIFKLRSRPPEGRILSAEEIEEIGYTWQLMVRVA